jgi:hypothetical protein
LIAKASRKRTLTVIAAMQIDQCSTDRAVTHPPHQLTQVRACIRD